MKLEGIKANFLGDSITEGCGVADRENIFCNRLQKTYHMAEARNYGIGGTRIARQAIDRTPGWDLDYCSRVEQMDPDADLVVVFGGTNDFGHGDVSVGEFHDRDNTSFYGACRLMMERLIAKYPGKPIVIMTPLHRLGEESVHGDGSKAQISAPLITYVNAIREVAAYYSLPVLDLWSVSGLQPSVPVIQEKYVPDGLHPNDAGHEILAARIGAFLERL